jgi:hypothetical protein
MLYDGYDVYDSQINSIEKNLFFKCLIGIEKCLDIR